MSRARILALVALCVAVPAAAYAAIKTMDPLCASEPSSPSAGFIRLFCDSGDGKIKVKKSSGTVVNLEAAAGSGAPTDAPYVTFSADATLSAERVATDTASIDVDVGTAAQLKLNVLPAGVTLAGDIDGAGNALDLDEAAVESEIESVCDLSDFQGTIADTQIAAGAVDGGNLGEIADGSVTADDLGADSVSASELDATGVESELESALDIAGDVTGTGLAAVDLDEAAVESELEAVLDLDQLQGAVTDSQVPNTITVSLAAAATALAANGGNCSGNNFALGVDASGVGECAQPAFSGLSGAATDAQVPDNITVTLAGTATALAGNGANCNAGSYPLGVDASGAVESCAVAPGAYTVLTASSTVSDAVIATYTAIPGIAFTPEAGATYRMSCFIVYTSTAATTGINFAWDVPASVTSIHMTGYTTTVATGANEGFIQRADNVGSSTSASIITVENVAFLEALFRNGANATSTTLGFTPETANSVSVILNSSKCEVWKH